MAPHPEFVMDRASLNKMDEADPKMEITQDSALLDLPLEVFQLITRYMDAATFYTSLLTCQYFLKAAKCRPNVIQHLYNLPGLRLGLDELSTSDLLLQYRKRAAESGCAAGTLADVTKYQQTSQTSLSNAAFSPANVPQPASQAHVATVHDGGTIQIYDLGKHHVRLKVELHIRPEDNNESRMEIVKMAFAPCSRDLAVLYRHLPHSLKSNRKKQGFTHDSTGKKVFKLVTFHSLLARTKGYFYDSHQQETKDIRVSDVYIPVGLALAANGNACIAWKNQIYEPITTLTLIGRDEKLMEACSYGQSYTRFLSTFSLCRFFVCRAWLAALTCSVSQWPIPKWIRALSSFLAWSLKQPRIL